MKGPKLGPPIVRTYPLSGIAFLKDLSIHTVPEPMPGVSDLPRACRDLGKLLLCRRCHAYPVKQPVAVVLFFLQVQHDY